MSSTSSELQRKLAQGLAKIALAIRHNQQAAAGERGLTPTQAQILALVASGTGPQLRWIADWLGVTPATASDAVAALQQKGLVEKRRSPEDARRLAVALTARGQSAIRDIGVLPEALLDAAETLHPDEQEVLLKLIVKLIRALQLRGEIPIARMCVTCQHFRPRVHADPAAPHHCAFVDAAFGDAAQLLDCPDHEVLPKNERESVWHRYAGVGR